MKNEGTRKLVIVGGGTTGWLAAAALSSQLSADRYEITVIESSHIGTIGVGESVIPPVVSFLATLGLSEADLIHKAGANHKLGILFRDWLETGDSYFHPYGAMGRNQEGHDFFQCWLKARNEGDLTPLTDYAPAAVMARNLRFALPSSQPPDSPLMAAGHALNLDAALMSQCLRDLAEERKVRCINAHVVQANKDGRGFIESLELNDRRTVRGDFFLDCSGFRGLLIDESLGSSYESWNHFLPCDRAVTLQTHHGASAQPYTVATAKESGWAWQVPLRQRISHGYVYSSAHCSDVQAERVLLHAAKGERLHEPHTISIRTGIRNQPWEKNCVALGLAGGFLEPLESTAIHMVTRSIQFLLELFPDFSQNGQDWDILASEFNSRMRLDYEEIRDFIILHYCLSGRTDSEFWRDRQSRPVPDSLASRIELFKARGELSIAERMLFGKTSWQAVFTGLGVIPSCGHPLLDQVDFEVIHRAMQADRQQIEEAVFALPVETKNM